MAGRFRYVDNYLIFFLDYTHFDALLRRILSMYSPDLTMQC